MLVDVDVNGTGHGTVKIDGKPVPMTTACHIAIKVQQRPHVIITMMPDQIRARVNGDVDLAVEDDSESDAG